jgi:hypothetical protein
MTERSFSKTSPLAGLHKTSLMCRLFLRRTALFFWEDTLPWFKKRRRRNVYGKNTCLVSKNRHYCSRDLYKVHDRTTSRARTFHSIIHSFCSLSYDRSIASSKASSRFSASSFNFQCPLFPLRSSNSCLRVLLPRLPVTCPSLYLCLNYVY